MRQAFRVVVPLLAVAVTVSSCVFRGTHVREVPVHEVDATREGTFIRTPAKAHLRDGSVVVFREGFAVFPDTLRGAGMWYDAALLDSTPVAAVSLDDVVGVEAFHTRVNAPATVAMTALTTVGVVVGTAALAVAIFGSCPTFYADSAGTPVLEAEAFSYSIAPLFEARDVDRLRSGADADGILRLDVRNEAAETHYINHLAVLDVPHEPGETVVPDHRGMPLATRGGDPAVRAVDRAGRALASTLANADGVVFSSDDGTL